MIVQCITLQARTCPAWYFFCFSRPFFSPGNYNLGNFFAGCVFISISPPVSVWHFLSTWSGERGCRYFFVFPKAMWKKRFTCMHYITVWAAWPTNKKHTEEVDGIMPFLYEMFSFYAYTTKAVHFLSISPHVLFLEQGQIFRRKGNVYLNECTSVEVLKAPPEGYFTERKLMMQKFGSGNSRQGFKSNKTTHLQTKEQNAQGNLVWQERKNDKVCRPSRSWRQKVLVCIIKMLFILISVIIHLCSCLM